MSFFEVKDENGFALLATEDYVTAVNSAMRRNAKTIIKVTTDCGSFKDCKTVWSR